jgi:hypothetical protein
MGIYFAEGVYGIRLVNNSSNQVFYEVTNKKQYTGEEINQILRLGKNISELFDVYFYKQYSTTYSSAGTHTLDSKPEFMWVKSDFSLKNQVKDT